VVNVAPWREAQRLAKSSKEPNAERGARSDSVYLKELHCCVIRLCHQELCVKPDVNVPHELLQGLSGLQKRQPYCVLQLVILEHLRTIRSDEWLSFGTVWSNSNKLNLDFVKGN